MKSKKNFGALILFFEFFGVTFAGFCLCNAMAIAIDCIFDGFDYFGARILDLPFLLYLFFSLVISAALTIFIVRKTR